MAVRPQVMALIMPFFLIALVLVAAGVSIVELLVSLDFTTLLSPSSFRKYWFARFWIWHGPVSYKNAQAEVAPLLAQAHGRVLDIGTGTGNFLPHYNISQISKVYAVETNRGQHAGLQKKAKEAGLHSGQFEALDKPVEKLRDHPEIRHGEIDTIVTVQVLCSVYDQETLVRELYDLLRPGGRWIVFEHVKRQDHGILGVVQGLINIVWPWLFDGCSLCRDTGRTIQGAGKWKSFVLKKPSAEPSTALIPKIGGVLYKA